MRVVVNLVGDAAHGQLAESRFVERPFVYGGERSMYMLAFAAAQAGFEVELRGWLDRMLFERCAQATSAAPRVELPPRRPQADDVVVLPEGWRDPLEYARMLLSPARLALFLLAPPGLFGWPMGEASWELPEPLTVPLDAVAKPSHFQAMAELGFSLLTHSPGIEAAANAAGVDCPNVGTGEPDLLVNGAPEGPRAVDAIGLLNNRWAPLVRQVARELDDLNVELIGESGNDEVRARMGQARVLLWPSRIEGHATIQVEARLNGCVPIGLTSNRFAAGLSPECGAVTVDTVEQIAPAVRALIADRERWQQLSALGARTAREQVRWEPFVDRVRAFFSSLPTERSPAHDARGTMGDALEQWLEGRAAAAQSALEAMQADRDLVREDRDRLHYEEHQLRQDRDRLAAELARLRANRAVRLALRLDELRS